MTSHRWLSSLFKIGVLFTSLPISGAEESVGLLKTFDTVVSRNTVVLKRELAKASKRKISKDLLKDQEYTLHPAFLDSLFLSMNDSQYKEVSNDQCNFLSYWDNGIIRPIGIPENTVIVQKKLDSRDTFQSAVVPKDDYLNHILKKECPSTFALKKLYKIDQLETTVSALAFPKPKSEKDCEKIISDWKANPNLPYICGIAQTIQRGRDANATLLKSPLIALNKRRKLEKQKQNAIALQDKISLKTRSYLSQLCQNLSTPEVFCRIHTGDYIWDQVIAGEYPFYYLKNQCPRLKESSAKHYKNNCATKLKREPDLCATRLATTQKALFPKPNCQKISHALKSNRLNHPYHDCPSYVPESVTNAFRLLYHLIPLSKLKKDDKNILLPDGLMEKRSQCSSDPYAPLMKIIAPSGDLTRWPLKICYQNPITLKKECIPYIPGQHSGESSETQVISKVVYKLGKSVTTPECKIVTDKKFNITFLEYKNGCYVVKGLSSFSDKKSTPKIFHDGIPVNNIEYVGTLSPIYFPMRYNQSYLSVYKRIPEILAMQSTPIKNKTILDLFFESHKNGITHGIGCAENLLPSFFPTKTFRQCRPLLFIVDGHNKGRDLYTIRTAIDQVSAPRLINWTRLYQAVKNYSILHPLGQWWFYGVW